MNKIIVSAAVACSLGIATEASGQSDFFQTDRIQPPPEEKCGNADPAAARYLQDILEGDDLSSFAEGLKIRVDPLAEYVESSDSICTDFRAFARNHLNAYREQQSRLAEASSGHPDTFVYEYFRLGDVYAIVILESSETFESQYDPEDLLTQVWPGRYMVADLVDQELDRLAGFDTRGDLVQIGTDN